jgi:hypothetical protein
LVGLTATVTLGAAESILTVARSAVARLRARAAILCIGDAGLGRLVTVCGRDAGRIVDARRCTAVAAIAAIDAGKESTRPRIGIYAISSDTCRLARLDVDTPSLVASRGEAVGPALVGRAIAVIVELVAEFDRWLVGVAGLVALGVADREPRARPKIVALLAQDGIDIVGLTVAVLVDEVARLLERGRRATGSETFGATCARAGASATCICHCAARRQAEVLP